ncbi:sulfatase-like hydrolase/transferase [Janthinobacterium svalbardensis]|nr:sulfatase-like hydrolase/transferase [Janthinobacterium svalbardensis]
MSSLFTLPEDRFFSLQSKKFIYFRCFLWMLLPSIIWSFAFGRLYICIEPLFFPYLEKRLKPWLSLLIKIIWVFIFLISMLANWNIRPNSYHFYLFAVIGNTPTPVLITCFLFVSVMLFFIFSDIYRKSSLGFRKYALIIGIFLLILKSAMSIFDVGSASLRKMIITPSPFAIKTLFTDDSSHEKNFLGKTTEPTFLNHIKGTEKMPRKMVLLVVESWGESQASLVSVKKRLQRDGVRVREAGFTDYHGSTMQGEIRELCSQYIRLNSDTNFSSVADNCAPAYMKKMGYEVFGVHGYQKMFYARDTVWKHLGIDNAYFQPEMQQLNTCPGPFAGICDEDMITYGIDLIRQEDKAFLYMLSLSSHEPVASSMLEDPTQYFRDIDAIGDSQIVARNAIGSMVATLSMSADLGCTEAYIVGDHQPPSAVNSEQLPANQVPYIRMSFHCNE